jgi:rhodanese-related sulfurtransferase
MRIPVLMFFVLAGSLSFAQTGNSRLKNAEEFEKNIRPGNAVILDVRTEKEFQSGHISHALQANWNDSVQFKERVKHIDHQQPVYVYCLAGIRSAAAAGWMRTHGFTQVIELEGGINGWKKAGKPLDSFKQEKQISLAEFESMISRKGVVLVDFGADWCPPCRKMQPVTDSLQNDPFLAFTMINIDAGTQTELMKALDIGPIPVFIIYKNGKETWRKEGLVSLGEFKKQLR